MDGLPGGGVGVLTAKLRGSKGELVGGFFQIDPTSLWPLDGHPVVEIRVCIVCTSELVCTDTFETIKFPFRRNVSI
jgi:hypothetical protein